MHKKQGSWSNLFKRGPALPGTPARHGDAGSNPLQLSAQDGRVDDLVKQLKQRDYDLAAATAANQELAAKMSTLQAEFDARTKKQTIRMAILLDMLGLEILKNSNPGLIETAMSMSPQKDRHGASSPLGAHVS